MNSQDFIKITAAIRMTGQKHPYDEKAMRFTHNEAANTFLPPRFRNGRPP